MVGGYPILLDLSQRSALIVGGGAVAVRKAEGLLAAGIAKVRAVAPEILPRMPAAVERVLERFAPAHLDGFDLAFAATDSAQINAQVVVAARSRGILVNRADAADDQPGDFWLPATHREGSVVVAVSAGAPALAAVIRDELSRKIDPIHVALAEAMAVLRPWIQSVPGVDGKRRAAIFRSMLESDALAELRSRGIEGLRRWLLDRFADLADAPAAQRR